MRPVENLHYVVSQLAYSLAYTELKSKIGERIKFHNLLASELRGKDYNFDMSDVILLIMDQDQKSIKDCFDCTMNQIRLNSHYLSPRLKKDFIRVIGHVANAYPVISMEEQDILKKFNSEISIIEGNPEYYDAVKGLRWLAINPEITLSTLIMRILSVSIRYYESKQPIITSPHNLKNVDIE